MSDDYVAWPLVSHNEAEQARYVQMRQDGQTHNFAEMLATRSFPGVKGTDSVFMEGRKLGGQQFEGLPRPMGQRYLDVAAKAGVNVSGKYYSGTLARFPMDPRAWVSGLGDVRRIARERNVGLSGAVEIASPKYADGYVPPEKYQVAEEIVDRHVGELAGDGPVTAEVRAEVAKKLAGVKG